MYVRACVRIGVVNLPNYLPLLLPIPIPIPSPHSHHPAHIPDTSSQITTTCIVLLALPLIQSNRKSI